jgi:hypothetical protein
MPVEEYRYREFPFTLYNHQTNQTCQAHNHQEREQLMAAGWKAEPPEDQTLDPLMARITAPPVPPQPPSAEPRFLEYPFTMYHRSGTTRLVRNPQEREQLTAEGWRSAPPPRHGKNRKHPIRKSGRWKPYQKGPK